MAIIALHDELQSMGIYEEIEPAFLNWALHFSLWNVNTIKGSARKTLYNKLRQEYFKELGFDKYSPDFYYNRFEYKQFLKIKNTPYFWYKYSPRPPRLASQFLDIYRKEGLKAALGRVKNKLLRRSSPKTGP